MATRCEDYPCCGHTDGLGCNWTYTPEARAFDHIHAFCDHEAGFCEVDEAIDSAFEDDDYDGADEFQWQTTTPDEVYFTEDQWLDGSYEE